MNFPNHDSDMEGRTSATAWTVKILTLYPNMFPGPLDQALAGRALKKGIWSIQTIDIREHAQTSSKSVDDEPFGGGPGMVMRPDVLASAIDASLTDNSGPLIYLSPRGKPLKQVRIKEISEGAGITLICGRFEGVDERILRSRQIEELSVGDYVLSGGEIAALNIIDACVRLLPGVMNTAQSLAEESFTDGLLEYPQYTRPRHFEGEKVPEVLLSGNHEKIRSWRRSQAENITQERRSDLWAKRHTKCLTTRIK